MPRRAPKVEFAGPFKGLNQTLDAGLLPPSHLASAHNVEIINGMIRPRRGFTILSPSGTDPAGLITSFAKHSRTSSYPDLVFLSTVETVDSQDRALFQFTANAINPISYDTNAPTFSWEAILNDSRMAYFEAGDWTILTQAGTPPLAYRASFSTLTRPLRLAGLSSPGTPTVAAVAGGSLVTGVTYTHKMSYYDSNSGLESNAAGPTAETTLSGGNNTIRITWAVPENYYDLGVTTGDKTDLFANKVRIYRRRVLPEAEDNWTLVTTQDINANYSAGNSYYDDTIADDARGTATAPTTHGVPPDSLCAVMHRGRAFYLSTNSRLIYYSEPTGTDGRSGAEYVQSTSFFEIPEGGRGTGLASFGPLLLAFQDGEDGVWVFDTTSLPEEPFKYKLPGVAGATSHWTIAQAPAEEDRPARLFWYARTGIYEFNGQTARVISEPVQDEMFLIDIAFNDPFDVLTPVGYYDPTYRRYVLYYARTGESDVSKRALVFNVDTEAWTMWTIPAANKVLCAITMEADSTFKPVVYLGSGGGALMRWHRDISGSVAYVDDPSGTPVAIDWDFKTGNLDLGATAGRKHVRDVVGTFAPVVSGTPTISVDLYLNGSASATKTVNSTITNEVQTYLGAACQRLAIKYSGSVATTGSTPGINHRWNFTGFLANYEPRGLRV